LSLFFTILIYKDILLVVVQQEALVW